MRWLIVTFIAGTIGGVAWLVWPRRRDDVKPDVGAVSSEWINTHRADSPH